MGEYRITGTEIFFERRVDEKDVLSLATDIWDNPEKYSEFKNGSEAAYYSFLRYLWVLKPDGEEERLCDFVESRRSNEASR